MAFDHNPNSGGLFRNDDKERENQPDHRGSGKIRCPHCDKTFEVWISAWVKDMKARTGKFFSLAFQDKEGPPDTRSPVTNPTPEDFDDDIPF